jgi:succinate dehydrogenase/fumarate reductase flavoprotein subunit
MTAVTRNTEYDDVAVGGGAAGGMAETTWLDATAQADLVRRGEVSPKDRRLHPGHSACGSSGVSRRGGDRQSWEIMHACA